MDPRRSILFPTGAAIDSVEQYGWELPVAYADVESEYRAVASSVAIHDASYLGRLKATGKDALDLLNRLSTNKVDSLEPGQGTPTILTTDRGRILDVVTVVHGGDHILLLTSPGTQETVIQWLDKYTIMEELVVEDVSAATAMLALWGPDSRKCLEQASGAALGDLPAHYTTTVALAEQEVRIVAHAAAYLAGYYVICETSAALAVWQSLVASGATPMGASAYEAARVKGGIPAHGQELGEEFNPLEAGLIGSVDFTKGCYIGQEVIARLDSYQKVQKYLVTVSFSEDAVVAPETILSLDGKAVGKVTSVNRDLDTGQPIGLAYVRTQQAVVGAKLQVEGSEPETAEILALPLLFGPGAD